VAFGTAAGSHDFNQSPPLPTFVPISPRFSLFYSEGEKTDSLETTVPFYQNAQHNIRSLLIMYTVLLPLGVNPIAVRNK
jgi:hypothetical protein